MRLLGCFKVVPDLEKLSQSDWVSDDHGVVDTSFVPAIWNCFDESALEMMLKLSDLSEGFSVMCELSALTIGNEYCDPYLSTLYALGFQKAVRIVCNEERIYWPELTAAAIKAYVENIGGQDVIVMGRQSADGDNSKTPLLTAELLNWPCVTQVIAMELIDEHRLKIRSMTEEGIVTQVIHTPCVISVGDAPNSFLRVPTLKDRMKRGKQPIFYYQLEDLGIDSEKEEHLPDLEVISVKAVENDRQTEFLTGDTPEETAYRLYHSYLKERL